MADITNLLNAQTATTLDQRFNFSGLDSGQTNPAFLKGAVWMQPLTVRVGVREQLLDRSDLGGARAVRRAGSFLS